MIREAAIQHWCLALAIVETGTSVLDRQSGPPTTPSPVSQRRRTVRLSSKEALDAVYSISRDVVLLESCLTLHGVFNFLRLMQTEDDLETAGDYLEIHYGDLDAKKRRGWIAEKMRMLLEKDGKGEEVRHLGQYFIFEDEDMV